MAFRLMGNREEAEDVVQEVYLKLWNMRLKLQKYDSIEALAFRMTRNLCLDQLRRRKVHLEAMQKEGKQNIALDADPHRLLEAEDNKRLICKMLSELPEPQRSLVHLRHIEGKEYEEMAAMLNMKVNAIRVSISRARKQMREMLEKKYASWKT